MFKFIVIGAVVVLIAFALAGPAFTAGKQVSKGIKEIADDLDDDEDNKV